MNKENLLFILVLVLLSILLIKNCYAIGDEQIEKGKELFHKHCSMCHGENAVGEDPERPFGGTGLEGKLLAPALNGTGHAWHHSRQSLFNYTKKGSADEKSNMPGYERILSDEDIYNIIDYIQSLWPKDIRRKHFERFKE